MNIWFAIYLTLMTSGLILDFTKEKDASSKIFSKLIGTFLVVGIVYLAIKSGF